MKPTAVTHVRRWLFLALALASAIGAGLMLPGLNRQRERLGLHGHTKLGAVSPAIALLTTASGPTRAIAINALWMRATRLQDEGKFFELNELCRLITALEPRLPMVWAHWAWNLAYNVSVKFPADQPEERWRWIRNGIEVLRDHGIPANPRAALLYRELAWIFDHKIGQTSDEAHVHYKVRLTEEMQRVLGTPPYAGPLKAIAAAPLSRADLLRNEPVHTLVRRLQDAGTDPFDRPLAIVNRSDALPPPVLAILNDQAAASTVEQLDLFLRADTLRRDHKLDPERMVQLMDHYGPIDWRLPDALSLYWSVRGLEVLGGRLDDAANTDRIAFHAVVNLYRRGNLVYRRATDTEPALWMGSPKFEFIDRVLQVQEALIRRYKGSRQEDPTHEGYLNFLREIVLDCYVHNDTKRARRYFKLLTERGPEKGRMEDFVFRRLTERIKAPTYDDYRNLIQGYLYRSLWQAALGFVDQARGLERVAELLWKKYMKDHAERLTLPPLKELWVAALEQAVRTFPKWQLDRLRELYPKALEKAEKRLEAERQKRQKANERRKAAAPGPSRSAATATPTR